MIIFTAECVLEAGAILAEGPIWHDGNLWWVDIEGSEIHCYDPATGIDREWILDARVGFIVPAQSGDFVIGMQRGLSRFDPVTGRATHVAHPEDHPPGSRFNDAKCDSRGRLWAGVMALNEARGAGNLYRVDADWNITQKIKGTSISNGIAWSLDDRKMYYVDSPTRRIDAFDFDPKAGELSTRRAVVEVKEGFPDGMCIDASGNLWVATWGGWGVSCYDPRTGKQLAKVDVPAEAVTSCCFGGPALDDLYITTASRDLDPDGKRKQPLAGSIFRVRVGARGLATQAFAG
jgi:sugar lactone lactonase YvrE